MVTMTEMKPDSYVKKRSADLFVRCACGGSTNVEPFHRFRYCESCGAMWELVSGTKLKGNAFKAFSELRDR